MDRISVLRLFAEPVSDAGHGTHDQRGHRAVREADPGADHARHQHEVPDLGHQYDVQAVPGRDDQGADHDGDLGALGPGDGRGDRCEGHVVPEFPGQLPLF
ncbi:hypothetical protein H8R17_15255 [Streptomyces sp. TRM68367]|nr:hypothetical protein [Streptomyces sp. TRM68367]